MSGNNILTLVPVSRPTQSGDLKPQSAEALGHHNQLLSAYLQSHRIRNHSDRTTEDITRFLKAWFESHGNGVRSLYTWEAMEPVHGRNRVASYARALKDAELTSKTMRKYLGTLSGYFSYVLEHPYVFEGAKSQSVRDLYGAIEQPVSEFDIPVHGYDGEQHGVPFEPSRLYDFYECVREHYLKPNHLRYRHERARNYAMIVLTGESGLRADELAHLEVDHDLFFESHQLQTRFAKGTNGSGKRSRLTIFTPLARATIRFYINNHRAHLRGYPSRYLFFSTTGDPIDYNSLQRAIVRIRTSANENGFPVLDHFAWHWLRRIFATGFIERFPDKLSILIQLLGHVTGATVHGYIRHSRAWIDGEMKSVLERVELGHDPLET